MYEKTNTTSDNSQDVSQNELSDSFEGVFIPPEIWQDKNLSLSEKELWIVIHSRYDKEKGGCTASNAYLAERLQLKPNTIQILISKLKQRGLLIHISFDGRTRVVKAILK